MDLPPGSHKQFKRMIKFSKLFFWIALLGISFNSYAKSVSIEEFGLKPNMRVNAIPYVEKALKYCESLDSATLFFPDGRYDFWPQEIHTAGYYESNTYDVMPKYLAILIKKMNKFTLDGGNSEFIMHGRIQPITIDHCSDITIKNVAIDWDIPLTAQGKVVNVGDNFWDLAIDVCQYPYEIINGSIFFVGEGWKSPLVMGSIEFRGDSHIVEPYTGDDTIFSNGPQDYKVEEIEKGIIRFTVKGSPKRLPQKGNYLVLRHNSRDHAGSFTCDSKNIVFDNVQMFHTGGLGLLFQYTENITMKNTSVIPNELKGRVISGHDDGFHFMGCKGDINIDRCSFKGLMDDPINVHGTCVRIIKILSSRKVICRFMHDMSKGMVWGQKGDLVGFIENTSMNTVGSSNITSFHTLSETDFELEFTGEIPQMIKEGAALENLTWTPNVWIKNTYFGPCRARGLLVSTPGKVLIENCVFESSGSAILIAGDANYWYESGAVKDVIIRNNEFRYPCMSSMYQFCQAIITIEPEIPNPDVHKPFHQNITIENNHFEAFDAPILYAKSVKGLKFTNNRINRSYKIQPFHKRKAGITLDACLNVSIKGNIVGKDVLGKKIVLENMKLKEVALKDDFFEF